MRITQRQLGGIDADVYGVQRGVRPLALLTLSVPLEQALAVRARCEQRFQRPSGPEVFPRREVRFAVVQAAPGRYSLVCFAAGQGAQAARLIALLDGTEKKVTAEVGRLLGYATELCR